MPTDEENMFLDQQIDSLGVGTAVVVEQAHDLAALESDFICSRVIVDAVLHQNGAPIAAGPVLLILARGDTSIAQVSAALDGTNDYDRTPTAGEDQQVIKRALNRALVLRIPMRNSYGWGFDTAGQEEIVGRFEYNGPPLGMVLEKGAKRSWLFPRDIGWRWFIWNGSDLVLSGDSDFHAQIQMIGVWTN